MRATLYHSSVHLPDADLQAPDTACPLCDHGGPRPIIGTIQRDPDVHLLQCPRCRGASVSRMPTADALDRYYGGYYDDADVSHTFDEAPRFARHVMRTSGLAVAGRPLRVLDFGGGDGALALAIAALAIDRGAIEVDVTVVDFVTPAPAPDPRVRARAVEHLDDAGDDYDLVLASAILEHLPDATAVLQRLVAALAPGGVFYARTPWVAAFVARAPSFDFGFPGHVHDLGAAFFNGAPARFGLDIDIVASQPSIVENAVAKHPGRAIAAHVLKLPARAEVALKGHGRGGIAWRWVGGWEVFWRRSARPEDLRRTPRRPLARPRSFDRDPPDGAAT